MKYIILGANGQLGIEWTRYLRSTDNQTQTYSSKELDITDEKAAETLLTEQTPDVIINCAAYTKVDQAEEEKERADLINHQAVLRLSEICAKNGIKLVHYSTDYVFSGLEEDQKKYTYGYPEDAPTAPINHYGSTKLNGERAIQDSGADHLILRVSWLCGAYGNNFVQTMLRLGKERESLSIVNDQFGVPTFCAEVVQQTMKLIEKKAHGVFHLGSEGMISWFDFAQRIFELSGVEVELKEVSSSEFKTKAKRPHFSKLDIRKAEKLLGEKSIHWESGLQQLLNTIN